MKFIDSQTKQKLRGGYYTPNYLADFISRWVLEIEPRTILEPSCGDGVFFDTIGEYNKNIKIKGFEINEEEADKAKESLKKNQLFNSQVLNYDFLKWTVEKFNGVTEFDAVIGNPPFIRYQYLSEQTQSYIELIYKLLDIKFSKHTNMWVPFILSSIKFLRPGGRLGMVVPAEILHVMHAQPLRTFLGLQCKKILIFDPEDLWFKDTLQGAVILLAEKKNNLDESSQGLAIINTKGDAFTRKKPSSFFNNAIFINGKTVEGKWTYALLSIDEYNTINKIKSHKDIYKFSDIAKVDVGIVTGANDFFLVNNEKVKKYDLAEYAYPMFGRSSHCPGIIYDKLQHKLNQTQELPTNFIWFNVEDESQLTKMQKKYIEIGEMNKLHLRYKCRIRSPWFKVPSVYSTKIGMLKRAHEFPRLILNQIKAYTTDTAYRIITQNNIDPDLLVFSFINSFTALTSELEGRHYGGGVLELVPSEIEKIFIPIPQKLISDNIKLNNQFLSKSNQIDILHEQDNIILKSIGLTKKEIFIIQNAWLRLKQRRQRIGD